MANLSEQDVQRIVQTELQKYNNGARFNVNATPFHTHNGIDSPKVNEQNIVINTRGLGSITMAQNATDYYLGITFNPTLVTFFGSAVRTTFTFVVSAANASVGATYTNNGYTFTVLTTIAGATSLDTRAALSSSPQASGILTKTSGTGDATITFSSVSNAINARAHIVGQALLGPSYNFQPGTSTSVIAGITQNITQGSSMFLIDSSTSPVTVRAIADEEHIVEAEYSSDPFALAGGVVARATITGFSINYVLVHTALAAGWEIDGTYVVS